MPLASLGGLLLILAADAPPPVDVLSARPAAAVSDLFRRSTGWTGGDVAYSIPLGPDRTLWLFGDSFIGGVESGRRVGARMINNAAAWQSLRGAPMMTYFWDRSPAAPAALLRPDAAGTFYWPADGVLVGGKLYLFCKVVRKAAGAPGFEFDWFADDLLRVDNPLDEPTRWRTDRCRLPHEDGGLRLGCACLLDGEFLYSYGLFPKAAVTPLHVPLGVARIKTDRLAALDMTGWEYRCRGPDGDVWSSRPAGCVALFADAAPELSVGRFRGIDGLVAVYTPVGIGTEIAVRRAARPWGPWGERAVVYKSPPPGEKVFVYGAKAHPELSEADGQLIVTYCRNIGSLADHVARPDVYLPVAVEVRVRSR